MRPLLSQLIALWCWCFNACTIIDFSPPHYATCVCTQPEGCAAKTSVPSLRVGHQVLQVDDTPLHGLRHKETVMAIKGAFEGPMNKTMTFVILDTKEVRHETWCLDKF